MTTQRTRPQKPDAWNVEPLPSDPVLAQLVEVILRLERRILDLEAQRQPELSIIR